MANKVDVDVTLPSGEQITVNVYEDWTDAQIRSALVASGDIVEEGAEPPTSPRPHPRRPAASEPVPAETDENTFLFGLTDQTPLIGEAKNLIEQKLGARDEEVVEKTVLRKPGTPADVPVFADEEGVKEVPQTFVKPARTEEQIRKEQNALHEMNMRVNFPDLMKDADATRETAGAKWGSGIRLVTDLITAPLPGSQVRALADLSRSGTALLSTSTGRAAIGNAAAQAGKGTAVFAGADNAIRQLADTGEIDANQLGVATVLGGVGGAVLGPVAAASLGKVLGRFGKALDDGNPVTADELSDMAPELDAKQVDDLLAGFDEAAFAAKYEPKTKISMDSNVSAAKAERDGTQSLIVQQREIARAKAHKARTELAKRAEGQANSHRLDESMVELKRNMNAPRNKEGDIKWGFKFGNGVIERLEHIAAGFSPAVRKVGQVTNSLTARDMERMDKFWMSKQYKGMSRKDKRALEVAMVDSDGPKIREITNKYGSELTDLYENNIRGLLDEIGTLSRARGNKDTGFVAGYHPRSLKSVRKARKAMNRKDRTALNEALRARTFKKGSPLDETEIENTVRQYLRGGPNDGLRNRRVETVGDQYIDLYDDVRDSMMGYIHRHHENIATKDFFENTFGLKGLKDGEVPERGTLAAAMTRAMMKGDLSEADVDEAATLINSIFGQGRVAPNRLIQDTKSTLTVGAIGNPISTLTQVQDLSQLIDQYGLLPTMVSLFGPKMKDVYSIGLKNIAQQARTPHGLGKILKSVMDVSGFSALDNVMANTGVNASLRTNFKLAKKNPAKALKKYRDLGFSEPRARQMVKDLANRVISEDVKVLNVVQQGKIRPVGIEDLPKALVDAPNGRVFGTLLTWTAKQINRLRNGAFADMRSGHPIRGTRKMLSLLTLMGMTGAGVGSIKQFARGQDITPMDNFTGSALALGMSGKMFVDRLQSGNGQGAMMTLMPFFGIMEQWLAGMTQGLAEGSPAEFVSGIGDVRNYTAIAKGPVPKIAASVLGTGYDTFFGDGNEEAVVVDTPLRTHPQPEGSNDDTMPPAENMRPASFDEIKQFENSVKAGYNQQDGRWYGHESVEGGTPTLAWGHKVTAPEMKSGKVNINGKQVDWTRGLTEAEANDLFAQDTEKARTAVMESLSIPLAPNELVALTSLVFNVGKGNWLKSKARKALNRGDRAEFLVEAFDPVVGFVKVNGEPHKVLIGRRQEEKRIFNGG